MEEISGGIFANCTKHVSFEHKYEQCGNATDPCGLIEDMSTCHTIRKWMGFYIPSVICFLAVLIDLYCLFITILLLRTLNEQTKKRYVFVVVRLSSAILVALCIVIIQSTDFFDAPFQDSFAFYAIFFVVYDFSIFSLLGSFTGVAVITYFGVMRPLFYRDRLTVKVMYLLAVGICIFAACVSIPMGLFQAADAVDGPISCDSSSCQIIVKWLLFSVSCIILIGATSTLLFVTVSLYWHSYKSRKMGNITSSPSEHGRARLAWTCAVLIILSSVELIPTGLLLAYGNLSTSDDCDDFYRADQLIVPTVISCTETVLGSITFLLDPFINFFFDRHISKYIAQQIKSVRNKLFSPKEETVMTSDK
ncbi:hypothetical protein L3Y34_000711 [Caenorhabditis briggsae]|uniref:G-protein coupled receptors family 1 profile domain-containing protein n=1 Tax=Caenorhabditis briggsae TaxID=6238 RepID=A0AAE9DA69_CAEBR|nr:hypothetical protein L3Y34_000711 [Caenorhabditis briggsae]